MSEQPKAKWKLPALVKQKWLEALRSGEYKQGKGLLYNPSSDSYCCIGVLCTINGESKEELVNCPLPMNIKRKTSKYDFAQIHQWEFPYEGRTETLTNLNDREAFDFGRIADIIEATVETY